MKKEKSMEELEAMVLPTAEELEAELKRVHSSSRKGRIVRNVILGLAAASAIAILVAILLLPVLKIYGTSMTPTLYEGNIVVSIKGLDCEKGDLLSFYYNNNILVKRVIAFAGEWVDIDDDGNVYVNGVELDEPYVQDRAFGNCDIKLPYQVPDGCLFVMGDHRSTSKDSRTRDVGPIPKEKVVGRIVYRLWPVEDVGVLK